ncbi:MAG: DUF2490 domain-containing protein [Chitinophagaceae bacterium]
MSNNFLALFQMVAVMLSFLPLLSDAQEKRPPQFWLGYINNVQLKPHWQIISDLQVRTLNYTTNFSTRSIRTGLVYKRNERVSYAAGLAFFQQIYNGPTKVFFRNEWRPWQEFARVQKHRKVNLTGRIRSEQRLIQQVVDDKLSQSYRFVFRVMFRLEAQYPIVGDRLFLGAGHDLFVLPASLQKSGFLEQNRSYAGLNLKVSPAASIQAQYMMIFRRTNPILATGRTNVARLTFFHRIAKKGGESNG